MSGDTSALVEYAWKIGPVLVSLVTTWALTKKLAEDAHKLAEKAHARIDAVPNQRDVADLHRKADAAHERLDEHEGLQNAADLVRARELGSITQRLDGVTKDLDRIESGNARMVDGMTSQIGRIEERVDDQMKEILGQIRGRSGSR